ncbi:MAG: hypothetical protein Q9208_004103 [Pyrenodesmia sp. 3 TL-2023]
MKAPPVLIINEGFPPRPPTPPLTSSVVSPFEVLAPAHPNILELLMSHWARHGTGSRPHASFTKPNPHQQGPHLRRPPPHPLPPSDTRFALCPNIDGGSVERREPHGYGGLSGVYAPIFGGHLGGSQSLEDDRAHG